MTVPVQVMKFGGSSFADTSRFGPVVQWIAERAQEAPVVCVVSAPSGLTERYRDALLGFHAAPTDALIDAVLPLADSVGAGLLAAALQAVGIGTAVALGNQTGLRTDTNPARARLLSVDLGPMQHLLAAHRVVVVPGGQGSAAEQGHTTWLGKNSSDLSAVALAAAFGCQEVAIHSDVPGVYSSDPAAVAGAQLLPRLNQAQAIRMSMLGAKVLHHRAVQHALANRLRIVCRGNRGAFEVGTVLEADGPVHAVVVPDARSQVFEGAAADAAAAVALLNAVEVPCIALNAPRAGRQRVVVTCGFFDATHFLLHRHALPLQEQQLRLLSALAADGTAVHELVPPEQLADRAAQWHDDHLPRAQPLATRLGPFAAVTHV
ncbi:MAG: hypothetical protein LH480_04420 [Rubrivivax sp.]|nr:hypothetical protein [Rubrivivax sp.]